MADHKRPRNVQKARRGGMSLSMARKYLEAQSRKPKENTRIREDKPHSNHPLSRPDPAGREQKNDHATPSSVFRPEPKNRSPPPQPSMDDSNEEAVDEQAAALLNRFQPRSNSRPSSSDNPSAESPASNWHTLSNTSRSSTDGTLKNAVEPVENAPETLAPPICSNDFASCKGTLGSAKSVRISGEAPREVQNVVQSETMHPIQTPAPLTAGFSKQYGRSDDTSFTNCRGAKPNQTTYSQNGLCSSLPSSSSPSSQPTLPMTMRQKSQFSRPRATSRSRSPPVTSESLSVRRSARSRKGPSNYYAPHVGFRGYEGEEENEKEKESDEASPAPSRRREESPPAPHPTSGSQRRPQYRLLHKSDTVRIVQEPLATFSGTFPKRVPYCTLDVRQNPANSYESYAAEAFHDIDDAGELVHVDFSLDELNALCSLFGLPCSDDYASARDTFSRLIRNKYFTEKDVKTTAKSIRLLAGLQELMSPCKDVAAFFMQRRQGDFSQSLDLNRRETKKVWKCLSDFWGVDPGRNLTTHLQKSLKVVKNSELRQLADHCQLAGRLKFRMRPDIENLFSDARNGALSLLPSILRAFPAGDPKPDSPGPIPGNCSALLRTRELGYPLKPTGMKQALGSTRKWEVSRSWKGASNDVVVLSWSPDGTQFAAGAAAQCDEHNMQYNRNNNLLLGDLTRNRLKELPEHRIPRPRLRPEIPNTVSPNLYMSVSAMKWASCGQRLYTASYDQTVKIWDVSRHFEAICRKTLQHPGKVQVMAVSDFGSPLVATGAEGQPSFHLWNTSDNSTSQCIPLTTTHKDPEMTPTSLAWGSTYHSRNFLVAGMSGSDAGYGDPPKNGHLALWQASEADVVPLKVTPNSQNIFDISWHPTYPVFATASSVPPGARSRGIARDILSLVRIYEPLMPKSSKSAVMEFDCPALDINDVSFCPFNENYIAANCTDGATYVWDGRRPDNVLHKLKHDQPISELDSSLTREQADVGVRLALWGDTTQFYTGSSDGVLKSWNILLNTEDALTENVASFGQEIMSGAFSPDKTNMLIGDACGALHILSKAPWAPSQDEKDTSLEYESAGDDSAPVQTEDGSQHLNSESEPVERDVEEDLAAGRLVRHPRFGIGQGTGYNGPWAAWARPHGTLDPASTPLDPNVQAEQLAGLPVNRRVGLDKATREHVELQIQLATARNGITREFKRKRQLSVSPPPLPSRHRQQPPPSASPQRQRSSPDLMWLGTNPKTPKTPRKTRVNRETSSPLAFVNSRSPRTAGQKTDSPLKGQVVIDLTGDDKSDSEHQTSYLSDEEWAEEDHWWPINVDPNLNGE